MQSTSVTFSLHLCHKLKQLCMRFAKSWGCLENSWGCGEVARYCLEGRIKEVTEFCETDIVNTYQVWLRYELFRGRLAHAASETNLIEYIRLRTNPKPHLIDLMS